MICWRTTMMVLAPLPSMATAEEVAKPGNEASAQLRTWAVLTTPDLRSSGLEDQIIRSLSRDPTIAMVDREHLDRVAKEIALGGLLTSSATRLRQRTGGIVKADALVLLSRETAATKESVRLVISECRSGVRLRVDYIPLEEGKTEAAAKQILAAIQDTRRHFAKGVRRVFGVPPFVSRCLTHEHDYLQRGYSELLANALSAQPGVAVIEVEEAQQIMREISLTDGKDVDRVVPLFVEGEYEITRNASEEPLVDFRVKITRGKTEERTLPSRKVKLSEAARYVGAELPGLIAGLEQTTSETTLTPDRQNTSLVARADAFASLGAWQHSTGLREAALLLKDDPTQRKKLIEEYCQIVHAPLPTGMSLNALTKDYASLCAYRWPKWQLAVAHLEYLVRNQQVDGVWAAQIAQTLFRTEEATWNIQFGAKEDLTLAEQTRKRFLHDCYPYCSRLTVNGGPALPYWSTFYDGFAWHRLDGKPLGKEDLDFQLDMMENVIPEEVDNRRMFAFTACDFAGREPERLTKDELRDFLDRLGKSDRPINVFVGRMGRLYWNWSQHKDNWDKSDNRAKEDLLADVESLLKELKSLPKFNAGRSDWPYTLTQIRKEIEVHLNPPKAVAQRLSRS